MKIKVTGYYKTESVVDTQDANFQRYVEEQRKYHKDMSLTDIAIKYKQREMDWNIIDDEGHSSMTSFSLDWNAIYFE